MNPGAKVSQKNESYLLFSFHGIKYAISVIAVKEILWLPELFPIPGIPVFFSGVFNLRGNLIPVLNLSKRQNYISKKYSVTDRVIVIQIEALSIGIVATDVQDVLTIESGWIDPIPKLGTSDSNHNPFLAGVARLGTEIILIVDESKLLGEREKTELEGSIGTDFNIVDPEHSFPEQFSEGLSDEERKIFHERNENYLLNGDTEAVTGLLPVAIVRINGEDFGVELKNVLEFADIGSFSPIPCCPPHIAGCMNLRGDILTLLDIRSLFRMETKKQVHEAKVIIVNSGETNLGVIVDEVIDVVYLEPSTITEAPVAIRSSGKDFIQRVSRYGERVIGLLDISEILGDADLVVDESVLI